MEDLQGMGTFSGKPTFEIRISDCGVCTTDMVIEEDCFECIFQHKEESPLSKIIQTL